MRMAPIKILASQAHSVNLYKKLRTKVMKCCANIYFNRECLSKKIIPKYEDPKSVHIYLKYLKHGSIIGLMMTL